MGLTNSAVGRGAVDCGLVIRRREPTDRVVALAGNPNVGKSTLFNSLTGMNQHTGNWPGKTVSNAQGWCAGKEHGYVLVDIPGTYSLMAHSAEEEVARNFICFGGADGVVVVCDGTCLERNLNLVLQTLEITANVVVCVNLMDEAKRRRIRLNLPMLAKRLGVPVVGTVARRRRTLDDLLRAVDRATSGRGARAPRRPNYPPEVEQAVAVVAREVQKLDVNGLDPHWLSLKLLDRDRALLDALGNFLGRDILEDEGLSASLEQAWELLRAQDIDPDKLKDFVVSALVSEAEELCRGVVTYEKEVYDSRDRALDRVLTGRRVGYPVMVGLLAVVFWLTITGANYPSQLISNVLFWVQDELTAWFMAAGAPDWLHGALVLGVYRVLAWVVSVMLPPMAIFFPLFTLLEDAGYLPRVAYNLDKPFQRCKACGKQALTMCMGFGCNAAGVIGCRIIDSPRERLLAMLTNNFVPCNGRFPTLIAILTMFFVGTGGGLWNSVLSALLLTGVIVLGVGMTFVSTRLLSATVLKGTPTSFTLELPPYRRPQIGQVLVRSVLDRTLFVLGRAAAVAAPAGLVIWATANITVGEVTLLALCAQTLDPFARLLGLDGVILLAFILGLPANEIVVPIILMAYLAQGSILELDDLAQMKTLLVDNGWTWVTAVCTMLFSLMHWPCSTTLLTIKKETGSWKWTGAALLLPTVMGVAACFVVAQTARLFG